MNSAQNYDPRYNAKVYVPKRIPAQRAACATPVERPQPPRRAPRPLAVSEIRTRAASTPSIRRSESTPSTPSYLRNFAARMPTGRRRSLEWSTPGNTLARVPPDRSPFTLRKRRGSGTYTE